MMMDRSKLKEIQVRLLLSSRAEMQKVIETARQTTISFMQFQQKNHQPPSAASTPQSPPLQSIQQKQQQLSLQPPQIPPQIIQQSLMTNNANAITGLLTQQIYQQQLQLKQKQLQQQQQQMPLLKRNESEDSSSKRRSRSHSRSRSRSRSPSNRSRRRRDRRTRSRSPSYRSRNERSTSREKSRRTSRIGKPSRFDNRNDRKHEEKDIDKRTTRPNDTREIAPSGMQTHAANVFPGLIANGASFGLNNASNSLPVFQSNMSSLMNINDAHQKMLANYQTIQQNPTNMPNVPGLTFQNPYNNPMNSFNSNLNLGMANQLGNNRNHTGDDRQFNNTNSNAQSNATGNCVKVTGVHNYVSYAEIRKFFAGLQICADGIKMINDHDGKRTGTVYIRFAWAGSVPKAIERSNSERMLRNTIQMHPLDDKEFTDAVDNFRPNNRNNHNRNQNQNRGGRDNRRDNSDNDSENDDVMCISDSNDSGKVQIPFTTVLIEDLPPFTKEQDIMKMFSAYPLVHIVMAKRPKMFSSYVKFHSADDARVAVNDTASHKISFKTVYLSACSEEEFETARKEFSGELDIDFGIRSPDTNNSKDSKRRGHNSSDHDDSLNDDNSQSHDTSDGDNSVDQSTNNKVPKLSLEGIPGVNLADPRVNRFNFPNTQGKADNKTSERQDPRLSSRNHSNGNSFNTNNSNDQNSDITNCILISNMEYRTTENEITEWLAKSNLASIRIQLLFNNRNQTNGTCYVQFLTPTDAEKSISLDGTKFKSRNVSIKLVPFQVVQSELATLNSRMENNMRNNMLQNMAQNNMMNNMGNFANNFGNNNMFPNGPMPNARMNFQRRDNGNNGNNGNNGPFNNMMGCVVALQNVPYKAKMNDILDFFSDFTLKPDNIIRRFNNDGLPTGDARVCFNSPIDARKAVEQKNNCRIMNRSVQLSIL